MESLKLLPSNRFKALTGDRLGQYSIRLNRSEEHPSDLQSHHELVCRLLLEKKKRIKQVPGAKETCDEGPGTGQRLDQGRVTDVGVHDC